MSTQTTVTFSIRKAASFWGALVADAASLGLHWLYDTARIRDLERAGDLTFRTPATADYEGARGYFAHGGSTSGDSSSYGELCLLAARHLSVERRFDVKTYQAQFLAHFGPGGGYVGYVDSPLLKTVQTLLAAKPGDAPAASGPDDAQMPALAAVPALVAFHAGENVMTDLETLVRVTNNSDRAVNGALVMASALRQACSGQSLAQALEATTEVAGPHLRPLLRDALAPGPLDGVAAAARFGPACEIMAGLPVIFHIASRAQSFEEAIVANIRAGGDSCGRAISIGALMAAAYGLPLSWLSKCHALKHASGL